MNPALKRIQQAAHGRTSEQRVATKLGARLRSGSGSKDGHKGDMAWPSHLIEAKSTVKDSLRLELAWLVKISHEALNERKTPALTISFVHPNGDPVPHGEWVLMPLAAFKQP